MNKMKFETKDSGTRYEEVSGFKRDTNENKPRFDLIIPNGIPYSETMLYRLAMLMTRGAKKYNERNWEKAESETALARAKESALRHLMQALSGMTDEDHWSATIFNINMAMTIEYKLNQKIKININ